MDIRHVKGRSARRLDFGRSQFSLQVHSSAEKKACDISTPCERSAISGVAIDASLKILRSHGRSSNESNPFSSGFKSSLGNDNFFKSTSKEIKSRKIPPKNGLVAKGGIIFKKHSEGYQPKSWKSQKISQFFRRPCADVNEVNECVSTTISDYSGSENIPPSSDIVKVFGEPNRNSSKSLFVAESPEKSSDAVNSRLNFGMRNVQVESDEQEKLCSTIEQNSSPRPATSPGIVVATPPDIIKSKRRAQFSMKMTEKSPQNHQTGANSDQSSPSFITSPNLLNRRRRRSTLLNGLRRRSDKTEPTPEKLLKTLRNLPISPVLAVKPGKEKLSGCVLHVSPGSPLPVESTRADGRSPVVDRRLRRKLFGEARTPPKRKRPCLTAEDCNFFPDKTSPIIERNTRSKFSRLSLPGISDTASKLDSSARTLKSNDVNPRCRKALNEESYEMRPKDVRERNVLAKLMSPKPTEYGIEDTSPLILAKNKKRTTCSGTLSARRTLALDQSDDGMKLIPPDLILNESCIRAESRKNLPTSSRTSDPDSSPIVTKFLPSKLPAVLTGSQVEEDCIPSSAAEFQEWKKKALERKVEKFIKKSRRLKLNTDFQDLSQIPGTIHSSAARTLRSKSVALLFQRPPSPPVVLKTFQGQDSSFFKRPPMEYSDLTKESPNAVFEKCSKIPLLSCEKEQGNEATTQDLKTKPNGTKSPPIFMKTMPNAPKGASRETQAIDEFNTETMHLAATGTKAEGWSSEGTIAEIISEERARQKSQESSELLLEKPAKKKKTTSKASLLADLKELRRGFASERRLRDYERQKNDGKLLDGKEFLVLEIWGKAPMRVKTLAEEGVAVLVISRGLLKTPIYPGCQLKIYPPWDVIRGSPENPPTYLCLRSCEIKFGEVPPNQQRPVEDLPISPYLMDPSKIIKDILCLANT